MVTDVMPYIERWGVKYPVISTYKVKKINNEKKANNDNNKKERTYDVGKRVYIA